MVYGWQAVHSFLTFTTLKHSNTLVEIDEVVEKLLVLDYHHDKTINQLSYSEQLDI